MQALSAHGEMDDQPTKGKSQWKAESRFGTSESTRANDGYTSNKGDQPSLR